MRLAGTIVAGAVLTTAAVAQTQDFAFADAGAVRAQVAAMLTAMKPEAGFAWQPLVSAGGTQAAIEIWKRPGKPAVHPAEAEYAIVLEGRGRLLAGGALVDASVVNPGLTEGSRIDGGATRMLAPGDVILIAPGVPHWFGIDGGRLVLLGTKIPARPHP